MSRVLFGGFEDAVPVLFEPIISSSNQEIGDWRHPFESRESQVLSILGDGLIAPYGVIVVDGDLQIMGTNEKARHYLAAEQGLSARSGKLHLGRAGILRRIKETVLQTIATVPLNELQNHPAIVGVPDSENRIRYAVRVGSPIRPLDKCGVRLIVAELIDGDDISRAELSAVFGLSPREAELTEWFSKGMRVEQIAPIMRVSVNTARMHLRHVFLKCGCCTQVELARVIARVPVT
jgi:DNA-binding CsgD family transcriptional regulator